MERKRVFISYAREDVATAKRLHAALKRVGLEPWLDIEDLQPGDIWKDAIVHAIEQSSFFLALLSSHSVTKRGFVQKELLVALDVLDELPPTEKFIIPARLDDCHPAHRRLKEIQWIDLFPSYDRALPKLLAVLSRSYRATFPSVPTRFLHYLNGDDRLLLHRADNGVEVISLLEENARWEVAKGVQALALAVDIERVVYATKEEIAVLDLRTRQVLTVFKVREDVTSLAYSPENDQIAVGWASGAISIRDIWGTRIASLSGGFVGDKYGRDEGANKVIFSPDSRYVISLSTFGNRIKIWDVKSATLTKEVWGYDRVEDFVLSPTGEYIVWVDVEDDINYNSTIKVCRFPSCDEIRTFYDSYLLNSLAFSPNGIHVAAATNSRSGIVRLYDITTERMWTPHRDAAVKRFVSDAGEALFVAFSRDGKKIASGDGDSIIFWDVQ